jgi:hypothetical protein
MPLKRSSGPELAPIARGSRSRRRPPAAAAGATSLPRVLAYARREPSAVLFLLQLAGILLYPFMVGDARPLFSAFGILVLGLVVLAVRDSPGLTWVAVSIGLPAVVLLVLQVVADNDALNPWSSAFEAALYFYAAYALLRSMLADHIVTRDELWGIGASFTLLAWAFAYLYVVVQAVEPGSFGAPERTWMELLFLSCTTLSSTGLSDIVPVEPFARGVVMLEQLAGLGFVAMVVSRLVALTVRR